MLTDEKRWLALADSFYDAALDGATWYDALHGFARATGSKSGELVWFRSDATPFNLITDIDPAISEEFAAANGYDPQVNDRARAGLAAPVLEIVTSADIEVPAAIQNDPGHREFQNLMRAWEIPFVCLTNLVRQDDMMVGLSVLRTQRQGHISHGERRIFASIAPHIRAAIRTQLALENQGAALLAGTLEALAVPAFVCDRSGVVKTLTAEADALAGHGRHLQLKRGRLQATHPVDTASLRGALEAAAAELIPGGPPRTRTVVLGRHRPDSLPLVVDIVRLPAREYGFAFRPHLLIIARGTRRSDEDRIKILRTAYGLTSAESRIALQVAEGKPAEAIAARRGVSVGTIRSQIRAIFSKLRVSRQIELVARLGQL